MLRAGASVLLLTNAGVLDGEFDVCIVGSGPAGLACALGCTERGLKVLVLEAGGTRPTGTDVVAADVLRPEFHDPVSVVAAAALGGTSHWWGGRTVPSDPMDFADWPISYNDLAPWYDDADRFLGTHQTVQSDAPGAFAALKAFDATRGERWCPQVNMAKRWRARLAAIDGPAVLTNARVVGLEHSAGRVAARVRTHGADHTVRARHVVLACGGLGSLRLMLMAQRQTPALFGGPDGPLGRGYMGHLTGEICDLAPADRSVIEAFGFRALGRDVFARRRIEARPQTIAREGIGRIAFWLDDASNENPEHGSAVASAKYLAVRALGAISRRGGDTPALKAHIDNVTRAPISAAAGLARAAYFLAATRLSGRAPRSRKFLQVSDGAWNLRYHAEQQRDVNNRVSLSADTVDSIGLPKLHIDFQFGDAEIESVVRAHELLDADLAEAGAGRLKWRRSREASVARVKAQARDGYHQLGGAMMSADPHDGVVDTECRVHGLENLWVASSCVFPTGSHANPTLTIVALARRLAANLAQAAASRTEATANPQAAEAQ